MRRIVTATYERGVNNLRRTCYLSDGWESLPDSTVLARASRGTTRDGCTEGREADELDGRELMHYGRSLAA